MPLSGVGDWILLAYLLFGALAGYRRGLLAALLMLAGEIAGFVVASRWAPALVTWQEATLHLAGKLSQWLALRPPFANLAQIPVTRATSAQINQRLQSLPLPEGIKLRMLAQLQDATVQAESQHLTVAQFLAGLLAHVVLEAAAFLLIFWVILAFARQFAYAVTAAVGELHLAGQLNALLGAVFGLAERVLVAAILMLALGPLAALLNLPWLTAWLNHSQWAQWIQRVYGLLANLLGHWWTSYV